MIAAAIASPKSSPLTRRGAGGGAGRGAVEAGAALAAALGGPATRAAGAPGAGAGGAGRAAGGGAPGACDAPADCVGEAAGAPPGNVGSLIVAVGLGGKLMRTVSFFPAGAGFGGTDPPGGGVGTLSAIKVCL